MLENGVSNIDSIMRRYSDKIIINPSNVDHPSQGWLQRSSSQTYLKLGCLTNFTHCTKGGDERLDNKFDKFTVKKLTKQRT